MRSKLDPLRTVAKNNELEEGKKKSHQMHRAAVLQLSEPRRPRSAPESRSDTAGSGAREIMHLPINGDARFSKCFVQIVFKYRSGGFFWLVFFFFQHYKTKRWEFLRFVSKILEKQIAFSKKNVFDVLIRGISRVTS